MEEADPVSVRGAGQSGGSRWSGVKWWVGLKWGRVLYSWVIQFHTLAYRILFVASHFFFQHPCTSNTSNKTHPVIILVLFLIDLKRYKTTIGTDSNMGGRDLSNGYNSFAF